MHHLMIMVPPSGARP